MVIGADVLGADGAALLVGGHEAVCPAVEEATAITGLHPNQYKGN